MLSTLTLWWQERSLREKKHLVTAGSCLALFLVYSFLLSPYLMLRTELKAKQHSQQALIHWMQESNRKIAKLERSGRGSMPLMAGADWLSLLDDSINKNNLAKDHPIIKQLNSNQIQISFKAVSFDQLIDWLLTLTHRYQLSVSQFSVKRLPKTGMVESMISLRRSVNH